MGPAIVNGEFSAIHFVYCVAAGTVRKPYLVVIEGNALVGKPDDDIIALILVRVLFVHHSVIFALRPEGIADRGIDEPAGGVHLISHSLEGFQVNGVDGEFQVVHWQAEVPQKFPGLCFCSSQLRKSRSTPCWKRSEV